MSIKKIVPIDYTSRDFNSIKNDLIEYTKRYYPEIFRDFNEASFGSLMLDTVSYIGDILSFYLDYHANESFIETSIEYSNVLNHAKQMGYKHSTAPSSHGVVDIHCLIPASTTSTAPDFQYVPTLRKGTTFGTNSGKIFTLNEDVSFDPTGRNEVYVYSETAQGPSYYVVRSSGQVVSGRLERKEVTVGDFQRFLRVGLGDSQVSEIISVTDAQGNVYYEVDYLSQNIIFKELVNRGVNSDEVPTLLKPFPVPRRFVVEHESDEVFLQFGYGSESELTNKSIIDPSEVILKVHGKDYVTDTSFDPSKLTSTDKFGVAPSNTTLTIVTRSNNLNSVNAAVAEINQVIQPRVFFKNEDNLNASKVKTIVGSFEVDNKQPIVGSITIPTTEEIKRRAIDVFATQNRAVTKRDYVSSVYNMPPKFGAIKRCAVHRDHDEMKRSLNIYVLSENSTGSLTKSNITLKNNLKTWLNSIRMMSDSIKILDAQIVNIGIEFDIMVENSANEVEVMARCTQEIIDDMLQLKMDLGQPFYITDVFKSLKDVEGLLDVVDVRITNKTTALYSPIFYDLEANTSEDGRYIGIPFDHVFEVKFPKADIVGRVV
tara:strand:- start:6750 stop:8546 length:1797 start_codon:yes stop_codon:yes gene_type:complete